MWTFLAQADGPAQFLGTLFFLLFIFIVVASCAFTVGQQDAVLIQRLGKFHRVATAGLNFKLPLIDAKAGRVSLRITELDIPGQFKTKDNVFINMMIRVQYSVLPESVSEAFYKLTAPEQQISAFVLNVVRTEVARMELKDVFEHQDAIGDAVNAQLSIRMAEFGFQIHNSLVNEIRPDETVVRAMNAVMASENAKIAARNEGEAHKMRTVLQAEADAESKRLQGQGIAQQREAIVQGLAISVEALKQAVPDADANDLMRLVLMNQYFDALRDIAHGDKSKVVFVNSSPGAINSLSEQVFQGFALGQETEMPPAPVPPRPVPPQAKPEVQGSDW